MQASTIPARHAFSTRYGGVSEGDFASLNLGFGRGDPDANVLENYRRFGAAVGVDAKPRRLHEAGAREASCASSRARTPSRPTRREAPTATGL